MKLPLLLSVMLSFSLGHAGFGSVKFDYLKVRGNIAESTHKAKYKLEVDRSYKPLGEFHHQPVYEGVQFNVSLAAFSRGESIIMMHAEMHTDGSGGLDYSKLKPETLDGIKFTSREQCATPAEVPDPYSNPEFRFLRDKGFKAVLPIYLRQYFATSPDGVAEVVLTYGKRVSSCGDDTITPEFKAEVDREVRSSMKVSMKR
ncbi:MAG TPA: hypothetical protein VF240_10675 [Pyrinomonadaceae bacterium]